jgi:hypothetical protein
VVHNLDSFEDGEDDCYSSFDALPPLAELEAFFASVSAAEAAAAASNGSVLGSDGAQQQGEDYTPALCALPASAHRSFGTIHKAMRNAPMSAVHRISLFVFHNLLSIIIDVLTSCAERLLLMLIADESGGNALNVSDVMNDTENLALELVGIIARSEQKALLTPYFYRVLISKAGLRAKLFVEDYFSK